MLLRLRPGGSGRQFGWTGLGWEVWTSLGFPRGVRASVPGLSLGVMFCPFRNPSDLNWHGGHLVLTTAPSQMRGACRVSPASWPRVCI